MGAGRWKLLPDIARPIQKRGWTAQSKVPGQLAPKCLRSASVSAAESPWLTEGIALWHGTLLIDGSIKTIINALPIAYSITKFYRPYPLALLGGPPITPGAFRRVQFCRCKLILALANT